MKKYRFFYHYYRQYKCMSVHYKGVCYRTQNVICNTKSNTKWNRRQPNLVIQGWAKNIEILEDSIVIN